MKNIIPESEVIYKCFTEIKITQIFTRIVSKPILTIVLAALSRGYKGKTVNFESYSPCHRTTIAHFLKEGKWDESKLDGLSKEKVSESLYAEALASGEPIYVLIAATSCSKTKPSSRALHPIEEAYFHKSNLKKKQAYGH